MKTMTAKYPGRCRTCGTEITPGERINFYGRGQATHLVCPENLEPNDRLLNSQEDYPCSDMGYEDQCAEACGPGL